MAFRATVIPVMIASPGDVREYRATLRDVLHEWNYVHSQPAGVVLMPVGWETHSSPELGAAPQELINNRVLEDCDLLIGVFWTRLGTPTEQAASGTVEEIHRHVDAGKPAMVYFSQQPVAPENLDPAQYKALEEFKEWCKPRGLIETFFSAEDLRLKFGRHLQIALRDNPHLTAILDSNQPSQQSTQPDQEASLSQEAKELLNAAANDTQGLILTITGLQGRFVSVGSKQFGTPNDRRVMAKWDYGLDQLRDGGFVNQTHENVFQITEPGYQAAEKLKR